MSTKTLLSVSTIMVFLAGWAFGFSLGDIRSAAKLVPATEREQTFYDSAQAARLSTTNPSTNFRVAVATAAHDYVLTLSEAARAVAHGGDAKTVTAATDAQAAALVAPFESSFGQVTNAQHLLLWKTMTGAMYNYGQAKAANDAAGLSAAAQALDAATADLAQFYAGVGVQTPVATLQTGLARAVAKLEQSVDATNGGTLLTSLVSAQQAARELGNVMDAVTAEVVKANPARF